MADSNLVARLRAAADEVMEYPHPSQCDHLHNAAAAMREAADAIERLGRELYLLRNERNNLADNVHRLTTTIESRDG